MSRRSKSKKRSVTPSKAKVQDPRSREAAVDAALKASFEKMRAGNSERAEDVLRKAIQKLGRDPRLLSNLVASFENQGKTDDALKAAELCVEVAPDDARANNNMGAILKFRGRFDEASRHFRRAVELMPEHADAWRNLAGLKRFESAEDPDLAAMQSLLAKLPRNDEGRTALYFAIGRAFDEIGDTRSAWENWERGNRRRRAKVRFSLPEYAEIVDETIELQTGELLERGSPVGATEAAPILIVGMPRSGSTLIEQILASHPDVEGVGEVADLPRAMQGFHDGSRYRGQTLARMSDDSLASLGKAYTNSLAKRVPRARRIVDKYLTNFVHLGTVRRAVPNAKVIHAVRDPLDGGLGCFKTLFTSDVPYVYDLEEIGGTFAHTDRLMGHWKSVMPERVHTVQYESLVGDPEGQSRSLLDFLGLEWNDACLKFHETERRVNSASSTQVRRPMYSSSMGVAKRYETELAPLQRALAETATR